MLGITNDAWYGRTGAPHQFLAITALRSAESALWLARAANTGVSAFIDPRGRVVQSTPIFEEAWRVEDLPLRGGEGPTSFYVRHGDWLVWLCWAALALCAGWARWGARGARMRESHGASPRAAEGLLMSEQAPAISSDHELAERLDALRARWDELRRHL